MSLKLSAIILVTAGIWYAASLGVAHAQEPGWSARQRFASPPRVQAVGFSIGDNGYIAGGTDGMSDHLLQDLQEYDPGTNSWTFKASLPVPLRGSVAFSIGNKAFVTTGGGRSGLNYQTLEWDQRSNTWRNRAAFPAGQGRMSAVGVTVGNRGYVGTGFNLAQAALNDFWEYDPAADTWTQKASLPGSVRSYATSFVIHDKIYVGLGNNGLTYLRDWWEYTPSTNSWRRMEDLAGQARTGAMGFAADGKGYVVGGVSNTMQPLGDVWEFDPIRNTWTQLDRFPGQSRGYGISFVINHSGFIAAGTSSQGYLFDMWESSPGKMVRQSIPRDDPFSRPTVISPNPFFYRFFLKVRDPYTGLLELTISNMRGQVVFRQTVNKDSEYIVRIFEIDYLPDGVFVFRVKAPKGEIDTKQTVVHKAFAD